jgi:hypothetical protein
MVSEGSIVEMEKWAMRDYWEIVRHLCTKENQAIAVREWQEKKRKELENKK